MSSYFESISSKFLYIAAKLFLKAIEDLEQFGDTDKMIGTISVDLSKAFDSLPQELFIAKLSAYGVDFNLCKLLASYLCNHRQRVKLGDSRSEWAL